MGKIVVMDHPLIQHKIGIIRREETGSKDFRTLVSEIAMLMCYEATRDLKLADVEIDTPICKTTVKELKGKKLSVTCTVILFQKYGLRRLQGPEQYNHAHSNGHPKPRYIHLHPDDPPAFSSHLPVLQ